MNSTSTDFSHIVDIVYNLPIEYKEELKNLLEHNIADTRREDILQSFKEAQAEHKAGKLIFSSVADDLLKML